MNRSVSVDSPSTLRKNLTPILFSDLFSDVTFVIESTGERIPGHRQVLASASSMFAKMLYGPFVEGSSREVKLSDIDSVTVKALFKYIYTGQAEVSLKDIVQLMRAADLFCVNGAKEDFWTAAKVIIEEADCSEVSISEVLTCLNESYSLNLSDILSLCFDYIDLNTLEVLESRAFLSLPFSLCLELLSRDTLSDSVEETQVMLAALRWVRGWGDLSVEDGANFSIPKLEEEKMEQLCLLGDAIRLPLIPGRILVRYVQPLSIFPADALLKALSYQVAPDCVTTTDSPFYRDRVGSFRPWVWSEDLLGQHIALSSDLRTAVAHHYDWEKAVGGVEWHSGVHQFTCAVDMNVAGSSNSWLIIVGVAAPSTSPAGHLGAGVNEWGFACFSGIKISTGDRREEYSKPCKSGDLVTTLVDFRKKTLEFLINGVPQGTAFNNIVSPLRPAVSLLRGQRITLRFDED